MMSSVCTFRLKRRRAFSSDSPSCNLTSAKETTPPNRSFLDPLVIASKVGKVKHYMDFAVARLPVFPSFNSESNPQPKLDLPRRVGAGRLHEVGRNLIISRKVIDSKLLSAVIECGGIAYQSVLGDLVSAVQPIE